MKHLVLVRHGESKLNHVNKERRVFCGQFDTPLTDRGQEQASEAGNRLVQLEYLRIARAISSPLSRAQETLARILPFLPRDTVLHPPSPALLERSLGEFEGRSEEDVFGQFPHYRDDGRFNRFANDFDQKAEGG